MFIGLDVLMTLQINNPPVSPTAPLDPRGVVGGWEGGKRILMPALLIRTDGQGSAGLMVVGGGREGVG